MKKFVKAEIVRIEEAQPGMVLAEDIKSDGGGVILTADTVLSNELITRLNEFGVCRIYVEKKPNANKDDNPLREKRVVVVSYSLFFRHMFGKQLYRLGMFVCDELEDASDGMRCANRYKPDIIILDLDNPDEPDTSHAIEKLKDIHKRHPSIKILAVSTSKRRELIVDSVRAGAGDYMAKPIKWDILKERLLKMFEAETIH